MCLNIEVNKWAPKLTIIFQLTIWSIVGIILLQKGAISLCEKTKARNDTVNIQEKFMRWNKNELIRDSNISENHFKIVKLQIGTQRKNLTANKTDNVTSNKQWSRKLHTSHRMGNIINGTFKIISTIKKRTAAHDDHDARVHSIQTPIVYANNKNEVEKINHKENIILPLASKENSYDTKNAAISDSTSNVSIEFKDSNSTNFIIPNEKNFFEHDDNEVSYKSKEESRNETKLRRFPVNRIGAAIAIIMLAIGVVMLLLGPLIVIIRAFSNRRRTREMLLKTRCYNDQPPTYEEVTLMDQAPRYSTLQLDTILDSSFSI